MSVIVSWYTVEERRVGFRLAIRLGESASTYKFMFVRKACSLDACARIMNNFAPAGLTPDSTRRRR